MANAVVHADYTITERAMFEARAFDRLGYFRFARKTLVRAIRRADAKGRIWWVVWPQDGPFEKGWKLAGLADDVEEPLPDDESDARAYARAGRQTRKAGGGQ